jgi:hypothetical protein
MPDVYYFAWPKKAGHGWVKANKMNIQFNLIRDKLPDKIYIDVLQLGRVIDYCHECL